MLRDILKSDFNRLKKIIHGIVLGIAIFSVWAVLGLNDAHAGTILQRPLYIGLNQGLVGFWSFDAPDMAGVTAYDRSGQNNTGTLPAAQRAKSAKSAKR